MAFLDCQSAASPQDAEILGTNTCSKEQVMVYHEAQEETRKFVFYGLLHVLRELRGESRPAGWVAA